MSKMCYGGYCILAENLVRLRRYLLLAPALGVCGVLVPALLAGVLFRPFLLLFSVFWSLFWLGAGFWRVLWISVLYFWGLHCRSLPENNYRSLLPFPECHCRIRGRCLEGGTKNQLFQLMQIAKGDEWLNVDGCVMIQIPAGECWDTGELMQAEGALYVPQAESGYLRYLLVQGVEHFFLVQHAVPVPGSTVEGIWRLRAFLHQCRHVIEKMLTHGIRSEEVRNLYCGMVLGGRGGGTPEMQKVFLRTSSIHLFSVSGLHIGFFALVLQSFIGVVGIPLRLKRGMTVLLLFFYVLLSGAGPSSLRAWILILGSCSALFARREYQSDNTLGIAAIILLLFKPLFLLHSGFLFSFILVFFLFRGASAVDAAGNILVEKELWRSPDRRHSWKMYLKSMGKWAVENGVVWFAGNGLTMWANGFVSFGAAFANGIVGLAAACLIWISLPKLFCAWLFPRCSFLLGRCVEYGISFLVIVVRFCGNYFLVWRGSAISGEMLCLYLALLLFVIIQFYPSWLRLFFLVAVMLILCRFSPDEGGYMQFPGDDGGAQCVMMVHRRKCYFFRPGGKSAAKNAMRQMERSGWDEYDSVIYFLNDGELTGARMLLKNTKRIACVFSARMKHRYEKMTHDLTLNGVNSVLK